MLDMHNFDDVSVIEHFDEKINTAINSLIEQTGGFRYTKADLTNKVNPEETLLEYIRDTENEFNLPLKNLEVLTDEELTAYVEYLDTKWSEVV